MKIEINLKGEIKEDKFEDLNITIDHALLLFDWFKKNVSYEEGKQKWLKQEKVILNY